MNKQDHIDKLCQWVVERDAEIAKLKALMLEAADDIEHCIGAFKREQVKMAIKLREAAK